MSKNHKKIWITGASSGIGEACCAALLEQGAFVYGCARRADRLQEQKKRWGDRYKGIVCDLRDPSAIHQMFDEVHKNSGALDALVNNAGLGHDASLLKGNVEDWREILEVNVLALSLCTQIAVAKMKTKSC